MEAPSHDDIERMYAATISRLLAKPSAEAMEAYYSRLLKEHNYLGLEVRYIGPGIGKGVFAKRNFSTDELVFKERVLVGAQHSRNKADALVCSFCFCYVGSVELQIGRRILAFMQEDDNVSGYASDDASDLSCDNDCSDHTGCSKISRHENSNNLPDGFIESLINGNVHLPYSHCFPLPSIVKCIGGCEMETFCSETCAKAAWESYHSLLCTGPKSLCQNKDMLLRFIKHADETNDIFHVAAKVISGTILKASNLKRKALECLGHIEDINNYDETSLFEAWEPFIFGVKRLWWKSIALPADLEPDHELEFRNQIRNLASDSLNLLKGAIFHKEHAALFSLQLYGHIIGMFELNNLDLVVASPVEDYFIYIDELPTEEKVEVEKVTKHLLDALGDEYDVPCQGTAFFALQSCINHSCSPNTKAFKRDEDKDGQAVLIANKPIAIGDEITISYIEEQFNFEERKAMLEDYGFACSCKKCQQDCPQDD